MTRRVSATVPDELYDRLSHLAKHYSVSLSYLMTDMLAQSLAVHEDAIACEACAQIAWLVAAEPAGNA